MASTWWLEVIKELSKYGEHLTYHYSMLFRLVTAVYDHWVLHMIKSNYNIAYFLNRWNKKPTFFFIKDFYWLGYPLDQLSYSILTTTDGTMNSNKDINQLYIFFSYIYACIYVCMYVCNYIFNNLNLNSLIILYKVGAQCKSIFVSIKCMQ